MKHSILLLLFFSFQFACFGQDGIQWERVATPDSSYRDFKYISKAGILLYNDRNKGEYFASYNYGSDWEKLNYPVSKTVEGISSISDPSFKEDKNNNIYFLGQELKGLNSGFSFSNHIIYKLDYITHEISIYHTNGFSNFILDFDFLSNGDLVIVTRNSIRTLY